MTLRLYAVDDLVDNGTLLVEAHSAAQAVNHAVRQRYRARVPSGLEAARLIADGVRLEAAGGAAQGEIDGEGELG